MKKIGIGFLLVLLAPPLYALTAASKGVASDLYLKALLYESQGNLALAQENLEEALELTPDSPVLYRDLASISFRLGELRKASDAIEKAMELDPENVRTYILGGQIYWARGNNVEAERKFSKAVELAPDEAEPLMNLAMAVTAKDPERAIKLYKDYLARHPGEVGIQERVAQLYHSLGKVDEAKKEWEQVLEWAPQSLRAHLSLAQIAEVQADTTTAIAHYDAVLAQDPGNLPLLLRVGELRYRNNEMAKAQEAFSQARAVAPNSPSANFWLALLAEHDGDWVRAIELLAPVANENPEPGVLLRLSYYYSQAGQGKKSIEVLKGLVENDPQNTDFLNYLAIAYEDEKQYREAERSLQKLVALVPNDPEVNFQMATLYDRMGKFKQVEASLLKAIELKPDYHMALNYLGYSYAERNIHLAKAAEMLNMAIGLDPDNGAYLDSLGWVYFRMGKFNKAEDFLRLASIRGEDPLIWEHLAEVQLALGLGMEAILSWEESLRLKADQPKIRKRAKKEQQALSNEDRFILFVKRSILYYGDIKTLDALIEISVCEKKPCFTSKAQFQYTREKEMRVEIPGPLSGPVMLLVKSSGKPSQYGALHPIFQSAEGVVTRGFERVESIGSGNEFRNLDVENLTRDVKVKGSRLIAVYGDIKVIFHNKSGNLIGIHWAGGKQPDSLHLKRFKGPGAHPFPLVWNWRDEKTGMLITMKFISPVVKFLPVTHEEEDPPKK